GDFAPDKAAADHAEAHALARERAQPAVVVERAVVDDLVRLERQLSRHPAGGEQQLCEAVFRAPVVRRLMRPRIERRDPTAQVQLGSGGGGLAPDRLLRRAFPERFRERRSVGGRVRLGTDHADRAGGIGRADGLGGGVGGHAAADDQIGIVGHWSTVGGGRRVLPGTLPWPAADGAPHSASSDRCGCFSLRRYCLTDRCTLCAGVLSRCFTGALGLGTRTVSLSFFRVMTRAAPGSAWRDGRSGGRGTAAYRGACGNLITCVSRTRHAVGTTAVP